MNLAKLESFQVMVGYVCISLDIQTQNLKILDFLCICFVLF